MMHSNRQARTGKAGLRLSILIEEWNFVLAEYRDILALDKVQ